MRQKIKYDDKLIDFLALTITTTARNGGSGNGQVPEHHLHYLLLKMMGHDGICLDSDSIRTRDRIRQLLERLDPEIIEKKEAEEFDKEAKKVEIHID